MVFINSIGFIAITIILCATICNGKNVYDDIDTHGSDGKPISITIKVIFKKKHTRGTYTHIHTHQQTTTCHRISNTIEIVFVHSKHIKCL